MPMGRKLTVAESEGRLSIVFPSLGLGSPGLMGLPFVVFFFFSSRRRHTRLVSDWSSDVCSSDPSRRRHTRLVSDWSSDVCSSDLEEHTSELQSLTNLVCRLLLRSEERRVGKECRSRWSPFLLKKKGRGVGGRGR